MKTKIVILLLTVAGISCGYAQMVTPFTPAQRGEDGKRVYVKPQTDYKRSSISIGYGYGSITMTNWTANRVAKSKSFGGENMKKVGELNSRTGTFSFSYGFEFNPWLEIDFPIIISVGSGEFISGTNQAVSPPYNYYDTWAYIMPTARINWLRNEWFALYTKAGIGGGALNRWESDDKTLTYWPVFAWQVTPVGVEFGKNWFNFFIEGGYGYTGLVQAGFKFKFGKKANAQGGFDAENDYLWYKRYLPK